MAKMCRYCGNKFEEGTGFCSEQCKESYEKEMARDMPRKKFFVAAAVVEFLVMIIGVLVGVYSNNFLWVRVGIVLFGITFVILPFPTPETFVMLGYRKSKMMARIAGVILIALGILMGFLA